MSWRLKWKELREVPFGTSLRFAEAWDIFPYCIVQAGTRCVMVEHADDVILVLPEDAKVRKTLGEWDGCVQFAPINDGDDWDDSSPIALAEAYDNVT
jgi:hypothetical protein